MYRLIMGLGIAAALCLAALGCGSGADEATPAPLTKAQFVKQANAICSRGSAKRNASIEAFNKQLPGGPAASEAHFGEALEKLVGPSVQQQVKELEALEPPEKDQTTVSQVLDGLSKIGSALEAQGEKALSDPSIPGYQKRAEAYGLESCMAVL